MEWGTICSENMIHTMKPHECTLMRMLHHWIIHAACIVQPSQKNTMVYTGTALSWYGKVLKNLILLLISSYLIPFTSWYSNFPAISLHSFHGFSHMSLDFVGFPAIQTIHSSARQRPAVEVLFEPSDLREGLAALRHHEGTLGPSERSGHAHAGAVPGIIKGGNRNSLNRWTEQVKYGKISM